MLNFSEKFSKSNQKVSKLDFDIFRPRLLEIFENWKNKNERDVAVSETAIGDNIDGNAFGTTKENEEDSEKEAEKENN